jgi:hypothetical protein
VTVYRAPSTDDGRLIPIEERPTALYRCYDADGAVLYVGIGVDPDARVRAHRRKAWGGLIASADHTWYRDRRAARAAELAEIDAEKPPYSKREKDGWHWTHDATEEQKAGLHAPRRRSPSYFVPSPDVQLPGAAFL